ncbi:MAG TPA: hypothetical protein VFA71_07535 [Terriglobales bacterium]|nr:hypothetical protein [Terriglobales bacterium]
MADDGIRWGIIIFRSIPAIIGWLIRGGLLVGGGYFLFIGEWFTGFACLAFLAVWKLLHISSRLTEIRDTLRGADFADDTQYPPLTWTLSKILEHAHSTNEKLKEIHAYSNIIKEDISKEIYANADMITKEILKQRLSQQPEVETDKLSLKTVEPPPAPPSDFVYKP